jgi:hypothetical protein
MLALAPCTWGKFSQRYTPAVFLRVQITTCVIRAAVYPGFVPLAVQTALQTWCTSIWRYNYPLVTCGPLAFAIFFRGKVKSSVHHGARHERTRSSRYRPSTFTVTSSLDYYQHGIIEYITWGLVQSQSLHDILDRDTGELWDHHVPVTKVALLMRSGIIYIRLAF